MRKIYSLVSFIYIMSFNFQNLFLKDYIGTIGASGLTLLTPITLGLFIIKKFKLNKLDKQLIYYLMYMISISFISFFYRGLNYNSWSFYGEDLFLKSLKLIVYNMIGFFSIVIFSKILSKLSFQMKRNFFNFSSSLIILFFLYEKKITIGRIKLLSSEPSEAGFIVVIMFLLGLYYNLNNKIRLLYIVFLLVLLINISSKGTIISLLISLILSILFRVKLKKMTSAIILILLLFFIFKGLFLENLMSSIVNDLKYFTSVITRSFSILTAVKVFSTNLLGTSGSYLYYLSKEGHEVYLTLKNMYPNLNYSEIALQLKTGTYLAPKSGIFMDLILYGLYAIYFYIWSFRYFYNNIKSNLNLLVLIIFTYISMIFYIDKYMTPTYVLVFTMLQTIIMEKKNRN